jgi:hypothetical protein
LKTGQDKTAGNINTGRQRRRWRNNTKIASTFRHEGKNYNNGRQPEIKSEPDKGTTVAIGVAADRIIKIK